MTWHNYKCYLVILVVALFVDVASGQVQTGTPPFGSFGGGPEVINLANLNSQLTIPVHNKAGRGSSFSYNLVYNSSVWAPAGGAWQPTANSGWSSTQQGAAGALTYFGEPITCYADGAQDFIYFEFFYADPLGVTHLFSFQTGSGNNPLHKDSLCGVSSTTALATDGSGLKITAHSSGPSSPITVTITDRSGRTFVPSIQGQTIGTVTQTDRNGNQITLSPTGIFTDTLGTTALTVTGSGTAASPYVFTYAAPSGGNASYTMKFTTYSIQTNFGCANISEYGTNGTTTMNLVSEIDLPDYNSSTNPNSRYLFTYEPTPNHTGFVTGRLQSVTLPTGGSITYTYTGGSSGHITCSDGTAAGLQRVVSDGAAWSNTWNYARSAGSGAASTTTVTDPNNKQTAIQFQGIYETQRQVYDGLVGGTLLQTTNTCYNGVTSPCTGTAITLPITSRSVVSNVPGSTLTSKRAETWNTYGMPTEIDEYDFGTNTSGPLLRKTLISYAALGNNINAFSQTITVCSPSGSASACGGTGTVIAQTTNSYDQTSVSASSGTPQHVSVSGSRGNLTTVSQMTTGSSTLSKTFTYYDTGMPKTAVDVNGSGSTVTYNYANATSTCGNAFATSITEPLSLSRSMTWNCTGGVQLTSVDENGKTTTSTWNDPYFWRLNASTDTASNTSYISYSADGKVITPFLEFNSNSSIVGVAHNFDGLGRPAFDQHYQSPSGTSFDTISYTYDNFGRPFTSTMPCSVGAGLNCPNATPKTTTTYDVLGRVQQVTDGGGGWVKYTYAGNDILVEIGPNPTGENTKRRQLEYDALGRLTSVCELSAGTGSGTCGQTTSQTGFWTKYTYDLLGNLTGVTQNAQAGSGQQTRAFLYDSMGRMTSETNPESGLTLYTYETATGCTGTYNGDLVKRIDQQGNSACFAYDALHRNTSITYSGPYAGVTPSRYFVYDSATVAGTAMANAKGHLAEAYTCTTCPGTKITDEGFSYTARGEVSDVYQMTPHTSPNYYHVAQAYWPHGLPSQLSATYNGTAITGLPTINYGGTTGSGIDGQGRATQVIASSGQNPIAGMNYNLYATPPQVTATLGSSDTDAFSLDANTGRMTQYKFTVGSTPQSVVGNLTWNNNGSLKQLAITDPFNSANVQTCNYSHDDLSRIATVDCGAIKWQQNFSYDAFGNITKTVPGGGTGNSFQPTYNSATNRYSSIPGTTVSYDNNGNITNDGLHGYSWDADGNSITQDTVNLTFDALDRMVEQARGTNYTQIVYAPTGGKLALMSGSTLQKAFIPLPGGGTAVYTSSGLAYYRHSDWLGSSRFASTTSRTMYSSAAYAPFGEPYAQAGTADLNFTGMNSDTSGSSYDFLFRQYGTQGRWPSPDPAGLAAVNPAAPQSWNRYAYVLNNPMALVDPTGLVCNPATDNGLAGGDPLGNGTGIFTPEDCLANGGTWDSSGFGFIGGSGGGNGDPASPPGNPTPGCEWQTDENGIITVKCEDHSSGGGGALAPQKGNGGGLLTGLSKAFKAAVCRALPTGRSTSVGTSLGGIGFVGGSADIVVNYNSGQTSLFLTGGGGGGWNGVLSSTVSTGFIYGLDGTNTGFSGKFTGGNAYLPTPVPGLGAGGSVVGSKGVTVYSAGVSGSLAGKYSFGGVGTKTTQPLNVGKFTGFSPIDTLVYLARRPCT